MNKQPGSTLSTSINGSRSCYISTKRFAFLSVGTTVARTIDISNNILNWFWVLFKNVNPLAKRQEEGISLIFRRHIAHLAHRRALRALIIASAKILKSLFEQANSAWRLCVWTIHVSNEKDSAFVIPTIRDECTTHCNCSQIFHTCLQGNNGSCRDGEFHDAWGWQFL